jgi:chemotaxis response regulator CheB
MVPPLSAENRENAIMNQDATPPNTFPIVCIGGSAGSFSAYMDILGEISAESQVAVVIVSHRALENSGLLVALLATATSMKVVEARDGMALQCGRIFVAPPHRQLTTDGVVLKVAVRLSKHCGWPTAISGFMFSLASMYTTRAIAIILSGMGHDGSNALAAIKEAGGRTLAQSNALYPDMPQAAIDTDHVDFVLQANEIGKYLASLTSASSSRLPPKRLRP